MVDRGRQILMIDSLLKDDEESASNDEPANIETADESRSYESRIVKLQNSLEVCTEYFLPCYKH